MVPEDEKEDFTDAIAYRSEHTQLVAVVRIVAQDEYRTTFEVVDALEGTWPASFQDNWYASWELPYPAPASEEGDDEDERWIASVYGLTEYPDDEAGSSHIGSVYDFRPATPAAIAAVKESVAHPAITWDVESLVARRDNYAESLRFRMAPIVVSSVVTGFADECCTGAGGTFVAHEIREVLQGDTDISRFVTGGHAYYGGEDCGDGFLYGFGELVDPAEMGSEDFDCRHYPDGSWWPAEQAQLLSSTDVRLPSTDANRSQIDDLLRASLPLYQLRPEDAPGLPPNLQDASRAPWSLPLRGIESFFVATHIALFQVEEVTTDDETGAHDVLISTTWSLHEYDHLERFRARLRFSCGDERLLLQGSRWIGGFVLLDSWYAPNLPELERGFLVPGALVPEWTFTSPLSNELWSLLRL